MDIEIVRNIFLTSGIVLLILWFIAPTILTEDNMTMANAECVLIVSLGTAFSTALVTGVILIWS